MLSAAWGGRLRLAEVVAYLDQYLRIADVRDARQALNGLQVENRGTVSRIGAAVDACEATIRLAADADVDFLLVHHGLFWGGLRPLTGPAYRRIAGLLGRGIAVYGAHLPLDVHPDVGNAPVLARELGVTIHGAFGEWQEQLVGVWGEVELERDAFTTRVARALGLAPRLMPFGPSGVRRVGIATGGGGSVIRQAAEAGLDTFVTGEGAHYTYFDAEELGVNVYFGGHYATETFGVKALAAHLEAKFGLPWAFLDHPTGL